MKRRAFFGAALTATAALASACTREVRPRQPSPSQPSPSPVSAFGPRTVGLSTGASVQWAAAGDVERVMSTIAAAGATTVRVDLSWAFAEPRRGLFEWGPSDRVLAAATRHGLLVLATLTNTPAWAALGLSSSGTAAPSDPADYGRFAGTVAERYRGRIAAYEIWNEPNGRLFFGPNPDPVRYTAMVRAAYPAIKSADPTAVVVAGALGNTVTADGLVESRQFLTAMYDAGAAGYFDALSYHPYDFGMPLGDGTLYEGSPMQQMIAMHSDMAARGDGDKKIWITEYGAPTGTGDVDEARQAELVAASLAQWPEVFFAGPFYVYTVRDGATGSTDPEANYGVVRTDFSPKPAYSRLIALTTARIPARDAAVFFDGDGMRAVASSGAGSGVGRPVSPVYFLPEGSGRQYENASVFFTRRGWFVSPPEIATVARVNRIPPITPFLNGYQDLDDPIGIRVSSTPQFGTHVMRGAILAAWTPNIGFPLSDEFAGRDDNRVQFFENGTITWNALNGPQVRYSR